MTGTPSPPPPSRWRRGLPLAVLVAAAIVGGVLARPGGKERPEPLPLLAAVDGPGPSEASAAIVYLHGLGRDLRQGEQLARRLRAAGLSRTSR
ncbi:MAG: hypothetical protein QM704_02675 [Anaeromyxobacteraceae bacterium]